MAHADDTALQSDLDAARAKARLVGLSAMVMVDGEIVERAASGLRRKGGKEAITPDDPVHVGSIGKSMTATAIARLVERGVLDWDDTVGERMPEFSKQIDEGWHGVTVDQLLGHRSALRQMGIRQLFQGDTADTELPETRRKVMAGLLSKPPKTAPDTAFAYNNAGYVLAAMMAETTVGKPWEEIIMDELAEPLGLRSLGIGAPTGDAPWGHRKIGPFKIAIDPFKGADNPVFMSAAGTFHITLEELVGFGQAHLSRDPELLDDETFERLHTPVMEDYAYGWIIDDPRDWADGPVIWHNGSNTMWYAVLTLLPGKDMVVAIATNDGDIPRADPVFADLLTTIAERYP